MAIDLLREGRKIVHCDWGLEGDLESQEDYNECRETEKLPKVIKHGPKTECLLESHGT